MRRLALGCAFSDRIEALLDGRVKMAGVELEIHLQQPQAIFTDVLKRQTFDLAEMSFATYLAALHGSVAGTAGKYVVVPVFLSRAFRHSNIYVRDQVGINTPADLAGKRIGMLDFHQTAAVWVRGMLAEEYGVSRGSVEWITGGLHAPVLENRSMMTLPEGVHVQRTAATLDMLLSNGDLDAVISPVVPRSFQQGQGVRRLFENYQQVERDYFKRTGIFPIMHCLLIRSSLLNTAPGLLPSVVHAFTSAKTLAEADLVNRDYAKLSMPWLAHQYQQITSELGGDIWSYGVAENLQAISTFLRYAHDDGITSTLLCADDVFVTRQEAAGHRE